MQEFDSVKRSTARFSLGTALSRVTGLAREQVTAFYFGASPEIAAFFVAYRFALLFRRFLGEGAFLGGFTPYYVRAKGESLEKGAFFFRDFAVSIFSAVALLIGLLEVLCLVLSQVFPEMEMVFSLTAWMVPSLLFVFLYMIFSAFLQSEKIFFLPGAAPLMFNVVFVGAVLLSRGLSGKQMTVSLAVGVLFGFVFQWLLLMPSFFRGFKEVFWTAKWRQAQFFSEDVMAVIRSFGLTFVGVGASQINSALDALFARWVSLSGPAYLHYASRLYQMPLSLVGIAFASALLPSLARAQGEAFRSLWQRAFLRACILVLTMSAVLSLLALPSLNLVYGHGDFDREAILRSTECLWGYLLGLIPSTLVLLMTSVFSARRDFKTPLKASLVSIGLNGMMNGVVIFGFGGGVASIAATTSLASFTNLFLLLFFLGKEEARALWIAVRQPIFAASLAVCGASLLVFCLGVFAFGEDVLFDWTPRDVLIQFWICASCYALFGLGLVFFAKLFRADEILSILKARLPLRKAKE